MVILQQAENDPSYKYETQLSIANIEFEKNISKLSYMTFANFKKECLKIKCNNRKQCFDEHY